MRDSMIKYISENLGGVYMILICLLWIINKDLFLIFDFQPFFPDLFDYFLIKENLNLFIFLGIIVLLFHLIVFIKYQIIFCKKMKSDCIQIYWQKLILIFFLGSMLLLFMIYYISSRIINFEEIILYDFIHFFMSLLFIYVAVGAFFETTKFVILFFLAEKIHYWRLK